jgi:UDPglucose--hexose-1-phosphate uridylyltransferase
MGNWERRWHPLLQEWVILAATTADRPWSGAVVEAAAGNEPVHDPGCYLCPGVTRASGEKNPDYKKTFSFTNDFASFSLAAPDIHSDEVFERTEPAHGTCRVICFSPVHIPPWLNSASKKRRIFIQSGDRNMLIFHQNSALKMC